MAPLPWGKRPCQDYLKALRQQRRRPDDGLVECHPLRHLRWTAGVAEDEECSSPLPPQLAFDARNSACHASAAAAGLDRGPPRKAAAAAPPVPVVDVLDNWRVADTDRRGRCRGACLRSTRGRRRGGGTGVTLDFERAAPLFSRADECARERADPFLDGATLVRQRWRARAIWKRPSGRVPLRRGHGNCPTQPRSGGRFGGGPSGASRTARAAGSRHRAAAAGCAVWRWRAVS